MSNIASTGTPLANATPNPSNLTPVQNPTSAQPVKPTVTPPTAPTTPATPTPSGQVNPDNLSAAANAAPNLHPSATLGLATTATDPIDAAVKAQSADAVRIGAKLTDLFHQLGDAQQTRIWSTIPASFKVLMESAGYRPPSSIPEAANSSWWGPVFHIADDVRHGAAAFGDKLIGAAKDTFITEPSKLTNAAIKPVNDLLQGFASNFNQNQYEYGTGHEGFFQGIGNIFDPVAILRAYNAVYSGNATFQPEAVAYVQQILGVVGPKYQIAAAMAKGATLNQVLLSVPKSSRPQVADMIAHDQTLQKATSILSDSGLSYGQAMFGGLSAAQQHQLMPYTNQGSLGLGDEIKSAVGGAQMALGSLTGAGDAGEIAAGGTGLLNAARSASGIRSALTAGVAGTGLVGAGVEAATGKTADEALRMSIFGKPVNPLSGLADGIVQWYANPAFVGTKTMHMAADVERASALQMAMGDSKSVEYLYTNSPNYVRYARAAAKAATTRLDGAPGLSDEPNIPALRAAGFRTNGLEEELKSYYPEIKAGVEAGTPEAGIARMLADNQSLFNVLRGRLANSFRDGGTYPGLTLRQELIDKVMGVGRTTFQGNRFNVAKVGLRATLDAIGAEKSIDEAKLVQEADPTAKLGIAVRMGRRLTNQVPVGPFDLNGPNAVDTVERTARLGALPEKQVAKFVQQFAMLGPEETGAKRVLYFNLIREVFNSLGVGDTEAGAKFLKTWEERQVFSPEGNDLIVDPHSDMGRKVPAALDPSQTSSMVAVPKFSEVYHFSRKARLMSLLEAIGGNDRVDWFMSRYWKPAMLFRPAFGVRFAGEEALSFMLRHGANSWFKARMAADVTHGGDAVRDSFLEAAGQRVQASADDTLRQLAYDRATSAGLIKLGDEAATGSATAINDLDTHILAHAMFSDVPTRVLREAMKGTDREEVENQLIAAATATHAMSWLKGAKMDIAGEKLMNGSLELAKRGVLRSSIADQINAVTAHGNVYTGDNFIAQDVHELIKDADGRPIIIDPLGGYESTTPADLEAIPKYAVALGQIAAGPLFRAAARGYSLGGYAQQIQAVEDAIRGTETLTKLESAQSKLDEAIARGADQKTIDGLTAARDAHQAGYESHISTMRGIPRYNQTPDGRTVASGLATRDEAIRAWAQQVVKHVNDTLFTENPQATDAEGKPIEPNGPQPIQFRPGPVPRQPYEVGVGKESLSVERSDEKHPLAHLPADHVRLFRGINTNTLQEHAIVEANPGRTWYPNAQDAVNHAGSDGELYHVDVPVESAKRHLVAHPAGMTPGENYVDQVAKGQKRGTFVERGGYFESGPLKFGKTTEPVPNRLIDYVGQGIVPSTYQLRMIPKESLPSEFIAPRMFSTVRDLKQSFIEKGMEKMVGAPANYISRQPIPLYHYANALDETKTALAARGISDVNGDLAHDIAMERSGRETIPFIHDPQAKSQFAVITRNIRPFWFAQEQFYKRWGKLFGAYPEAWFKIHMGITGLSNVGFLYTDHYGQTAFVYPGSAAVLRMLGKLPWFGGLAVNAGFSTELSQLNPTTAAGGMPVGDFGPLITLPAEFAAAMFHPLVPISNAVRGPAAPQGGGGFDQALSDVLPSIGNRFLGWMEVPTGQQGTQSISTSMSMSSAIEAMKLMELSGHGLTHEQLSATNHTFLEQQYLDRVATWTKQIIGLRLMFGFFSPGTPNIQFNDQGLGAILNTYMQTMPYYTALSTFARNYPNAMAEDTFASTTDGNPQIPGSGSGAYIPATAASGKYINDNLAFFKKYSGLAPWTIPLDAAKGLFNGTTYQEEKALNLREPVDLTQAYENMKYAEGANIYYPLEDTFKAAWGDESGILASGLTQEQAQAKLGVTGMATAELKKIWSTWSANFQATHPMFAAVITQRGIAAVERRANIVSQLQSAIDAGDLPDNEWTRAIGPLMRGFDEVAQYATATKGVTAYGHQRVGNYNYFLQWGSAYVREHPVLGQFWNAVLSKQVPK